MDSDYLFVYGTLLNDADNDMSRYLTNNSEFIEKGFVFGKLYQVSWYPGAILSNDTSEKVYGKVFKIKKASENFKILDDYEGIGECYPKPHLYRKESVSVFLESGIEIKGWIYVYNLSVGDLTQIKSGNFLKQQ